MLLPNEFCQGGARAILAMGEHQSGLGERDGIVWRYGAGWRHWIASSASSEV